MRYTNTLTIAVWTLVAMSSFELGRHYKIELRKPDWGYLGRFAQLDSTRVSSIQARHLLRSDDDEDVDLKLLPKEDKSCLPPVTKLANGVQRCSDNRYTLPGTWKMDHHLASNHQLFDDRKACAPELQNRKRFYPFHMSDHGCCSDRRDNPGIAKHAVYWPDSYSKTNMEANDHLATFLEAVRGRTILFLGDSITRLVFSGIVMQLNVQSIPYNQTFSTVNHARHDVVVPSYNNAKLRLLYYTELQDPTDTDKTSYSDYYLHDGLLAPYLRQSDIVLANVGSHIWPNPNLPGLGRQYKHIMDLLEQEQRNKKICFLWRRTLPQHFSTDTGTGLHSHWKRGDLTCVPPSQSWLHPNDAPLARTLHTTTTKASSTIPTVDYTSILQDAYAFHSRNFGDCSHYCYTSRLWSPLLLLTAEAIRDACPV